MSFIKMGNTQGAWNVLTVNPNVFSRLSKGTMHKLFLDTMQNYRALTEGKREYAQKSYELFHKALAVRQAHGIPPTESLLHGVLYFQCQLDDFVGAEKIWDLLFSAAESCRPKVALDAKIYGLIINARLKNPDCSIDKANELIRHAVLNSVNLDGFKKTFLRLAQTHRKGELTKELDTVVK